MRGKAMKWFIIVTACLLGGWWLFSLFSGSGEDAAKNLERNPSGGCATVLVLAVIFFIGLII